MSDAKSAGELYKKYGPRAALWKVRLQMLIGLTIPLLLFAKLALCLSLDPEAVPVIGALDSKHPLHIVGYALAISAGVELAHMLFTPGPDEAVEPLILGLSAAVLLLISEADLARFELAISVLTFTGCITLLFWVRRQFVTSSQDGAQLGAQSDDPASGGPSA
ncbi:hypothetical protein [Methylomonas sp. HYX-M1]|uniref:hypothetical protein n=1 Tax=Methylomonas sp. HYX-M1 TaxID=3139307 RepID=UPI00345BE530